MGSARATPLRSICDPLSYISPVVRICWKSGSCPLHSTIDSGITEANTTNFQSADEFLLAVFILIILTGTYYPYKEFTWLVKVRYRFWHPSKIVRPKQWKHRRKLATELLDITWAGEFYDPGNFCRRHNGSSLSFPSVKIFLPICWNTLRFSHQYGRWSAEEKSPEDTWEPG